VQLNLLELNTSKLVKLSHHGSGCQTLPPGCIPGGSSSGSAAAVASGHVDVALGRGLHSLTSELNLRTFWNTPFTLELNLSTFRNIHGLIWVTWGTN